MRIPTFGQHLDGYHSVQNQLASHLTRRATELFSLEEKEKRAISNRYQFEARRQQLQEYFIHAIGGLPAGKTPLNPQITGEINRPGYTIQKVIFESLPRFFVTGNLYKPDDIGGRCPAVLFVCGHAREAKAYPVYQKVMIALAKARFVVFGIDPVGQGERMQYYNPESGKLDIDWGTMEHSHAGMQCTLLGMNIARYFIWDGIRALDYLISLPFVDPDRIGLTGNSGGGTQSSYLMFTDSRFAAAMPCTYPTSRQSYMNTGQAHDAEQNIYGAITRGLGYDDLAAGLTPKPVQIGAVASDFFCIEGTLTTAERLHRIYKLYGCEENFRLVVSAGRHEYTNVLRNECVRWFQHHLMGLDTGALEPLTVAASRFEWPVVPDPEGDRFFDLPAPCFIPSASEEDDPVEELVLPGEKLHCTPGGQVLTLPERRTIHSLIIGWANRHNIILTGSDNPAVNPETTQEKLKRTVFCHRKITPVRARQLAEGEEEGIMWRRIFFLTEPDIAVAGIWLAAGNEGAEADNDDRTPVLCVTPGGTPAINEPSAQVWLRGLLDKYGPLFLFDPRGVGATTQSQINTQGTGSGTYGTEFKLNYDAMMMEDSLFAMRCYDICRAALYVKGATGKREIVYAGDDIAATWVLAAATCDEKPASVILSRLITSWKDLVLDPLFKHEHRLELYGAAASFDIPDMLTCNLRRNVNIQIDSLIDPRGVELDPGFVNLYMEDPHGATRQRP